MTMGANTLALALALASPTQSAPNVAPAEAVVRGGAVTIIIRDAGFVIRLPGRALTGGAVGSRVRVLVGPTNRSLAAIVTAPGEVTPV